MDDDTIHHPQRFTVTDQRGGTTNTDLRSYTHLGRVVGDKQVGYAAFEHLVE